MIALCGPLGAGKSELARALIRARAGAAIEVPSPSFTLVQDYPQGDLVLRHIDLYRLGDPAELQELGLEGPESDEVWLVEWPERAGDEFFAGPADHPRAGPGGRMPASRICRQARAGAQRLDALLND